MWLRQCDLLARGSTGEAKTHERCNWMVGKAWRFLHKHGFDAKLKKHIARSVWFRNKAVVHFEYVAIHTGRPLNLHKLQIKKKG